MNEQYIDLYKFIAKLHEQGVERTETIANLMKYAIFEDVAPVVHAHNESETGFLCSACWFGDFGQFNHGGKYTPNYCPNCGAKMDIQTRMDGD